MSEEQYAQLQAQKQQEEKDQRPGSYIMVGGKPVADPLEARIAEEARKSGGINVIIPGSSSGEHLLYAQREAERLGGSVVVQTEKDFTSVEVVERGTSGQIFLDPKVTTAEDVLMYRAQYPEAKIYLTSAAEAFPVRQPVQETPALPETPEGFRWVPVSREGDTTTYSLRPEGEQWASGVDIEGLTEQQKAMFAGLPKSGKLFYTEDKGWYAETTASASESAPKNIFGLPKLDDPRKINVAEGSPILKYTQVTTHSTGVPYELEGKTGTELIYGWAQGQSGVMRDVGMFAAGAWGSGVESMWRPDVPNVFSAIVEAIQHSDEPAIASEGNSLAFFRQNPGYSLGAIAAEAAMLLGPELWKGATFAQKTAQSAKLARQGIKLKPWELEKIRFYDEVPLITRGEVIPGSGGTIGPATQVTGYRYEVEGVIKPRSPSLPGSAKPPSTAIWPKSELSQVKVATHASKDAIAADVTTITPGNYLRTGAADMGERHIYVFEEDRIFPKSGAFRYTATAFEEAPETGYTGKLDMRPYGEATKTPLKFTDPGMGTKPVEKVVVNDVKSGAVTALNMPATAAKEEARGVEVAGQRAWSKSWSPYAVAEVPEELEFSRLAGGKGLMLGAMASGSGVAVGVGSMFADVQRQVLGNVNRPADFLPVRTDVGKVVHFGIGQGQGKGIGVGVGVGQLQRTDLSVNSILRMDAGSVPMIDGGLRNISRARSGLRVGVGTFPPISERGGGGRGALRWPMPRGPSVSGRDYTRRRRRGGMDVWVNPWRELKPFTVKIQGIPKKVRW